MSWLSGSNSQAAAARRRQVAKRRAARRRKQTRLEKARDARDSRAASKEKKQRISERIRAQNKARKAARQRAMGESSVEEQSTIFDQTAGTGDEAVGFDDIRGFGQGNQYFRAIGRIRDRVRGYRGQKSGTILT